MSFDMLPTAQIRTASHGDLSDIVRILASAFQNGDLAEHLIFDEHERARRYPDYFAIIGEQALAAGHVDLFTLSGTEEVAAAAIWYTLKAGEVLAAAVDYNQRLADAVGPAISRFIALDTAMEHHHPRTEAHDYLAFLAVLPPYQGRGLGTRLLEHRHRHLDEACRPAYLEATGRRNKQLYARHGYTQRDVFPAAHPGLILTQMWRRSRPST